jgi:hypothetical protein
MAFPLSDGALPTLDSVDVQRVSSDNTIDIEVNLNPPSKMPSSVEELLLQVGEFCLRYEALIVTEVVPKEEWSRINIVAPLYRLPQAGTPNQFQEQGFAFRIVDGDCSLAAPFPGVLALEVSQRASQPIGDK